MSPTGLVEEGTRITVVAWAEPATEAPGTSGTDENGESRGRRA